MNDAEMEDQEIAREILERISARDEEAAFELTQFCLSRVMKKDAEAILNLVEGLARISAAQGSKNAAAFLSEDWVNLRAILLKRLRRELSLGPEPRGR
jgi:hypothetical protein